MSEIKNHIPVKIIRSSRKTAAIEIRDDLTVLIRVPRFVTDAEAMRFFEQKKTWVEKHLQKLTEQKKAYSQEEKLTAEEQQNLADRALAVIPGKVRHYAKILGVTYGRITIRNQKTRWGSCSAKGNLNFNCLLMLAPDQVTDYVVVHELCHRLEMNHSAAFWEQVEKVMPDYREHRKWLKEHGGELIRKIW